MKDTAKKLIIYIIPIICIGFILAIYSPLRSGKETILKLMDTALKEAITIDYYRRNYTEVHFTPKPLNRKVKEIKITSENGVETIELKDSMEEYLANQLAIQYILAQIHPIIPNEFNTLFKEELNKKGITSQTGIIYRHNEKPQYSDEDSTTFHRAITTKPIMLDIKNTVSIQAWADCDRITILRHTNMEAFWIVAIFFIASALVLLYKGKKKVKPDDTITNIAAEDIPFTQKGIRIDENKQKIYIDDKECITTKMGFQLLSLFINEPDHFITREHIIQALWPLEIKTDRTLLNNRIDGHINTLRKALDDFPEYQIMTEAGKGYRLFFL